MNMEEVKNEDCLLDFQNFGLALRMKVKSSKLNLIRLLRSNDIIFNNIINSIYDVCQISNLFFGIGLLLESIREWNVIFNSVKVLVTLLICKVKFVLGLNTPYTPSIYFMYTKKLCCEERNIHFAYNKLSSDEQNTRFYYLFIECWFI